MNIKKHCLFLAIASLALCACENNATKKAMSYPVWPEEEVFVYDTIDCSKLCCVPKNAITVREAVEIGKALGSGGTSEEFYYIKGIVKSFNTSKHESGMKDYGNGCFYIVDNTSTNIEFYGYQVYGLNGTPFTSIDQLKIGDFVVICSKITNYNGTIETTSRGSAYIVCTTNELNFPETFYTYYEEPFAESLGSWTSKVVTDPGVTVWNHNISSTGKTSAMAKAVNAQDQRLNSEVWLVSPAIDLTQCTTQNLQLTFSTNYKSNATKGVEAPDVKSMLRLKITKDGSSWDDIEIPNFNSGKTGLYVADTLNISAYVSGHTQIAFAYKSTTDFAPSWNICNVTIGEVKRAIQCN